MVRDMITHALAALLITAQTTNPWVKLESDVGEVIQINTASIAHFKNELEPSVKVGD